MANGVTEVLEMRLLIEGIYDHYGFDLRPYDLGWLGPRILDRVRKERVRSISGLQEKVLREGPCLDRLLRDVSVHGRTLFDPPGFYRTIREVVAPHLRTFPFVRVWQLGDGGYGPQSLAIVLSEAGLAGRCTIYASHPAGVPLEQTDPHRLPMEVVTASATDYAASGGRGALHRYFMTRRQQAVLDGARLGRIIPVTHSLVTDSSFNEFSLVVARGSLAPFSEDSRRRMFQVIGASLCLWGVLVLGEGEHLPVGTEGLLYQVMNGVPHVFRRMG